MHLRITTGLLAAATAASAAVLSLVLVPAAPEARAEPAAPKHQTYIETLTGTKVTFKMVAIPGGTYMMGSPAGEKGRSADEGPQHPVKIEPLWMGATEVTWDEFDLYWRAKPGTKEDKEPENPKNADAVTRPTPPYADETFDHGRDGHPVLCITHHTAMQYCRWLSLKTGKLYRLPTEAEWEYAARVGTKTAYSFGDDAKKLGEYAWFSENSDSKTQKVGTKKPNAWGLFDMYGNVMEWCIDQYDKDYYSRFPLDRATLEPVLPPTEHRFSHVARGGSWAEEAAGCRSATRHHSDKTWIKQDPQRPRSIWWLTDADFVGFRVVRAVKEQDNLKGLRSKITRASPL